MLKTTPFHPKNYIYPEMGNGEVASLRLQGEWRVEVGGWFDNY